MSGCLRSIGCLGLILVLAAGGWITRDRWMSRVVSTEQLPSVDFDAVTEPRRSRAQEVVASLGRRSGPVFANLTASEATALVLADARRRLPAFVGPVEAAVVGDRLVIRSAIDPAALKGLDALGPIASMLESRQRVSLAGTLEVGDSGRGYFVVRDVRVNDLAVPPPAIAPLVRQLDRRGRDAGAPAGAIGFDMPAYVGDVRVAKGRITLYKNVP